MGYRRKIAIIALIRNLFQAHDSMLSFANSNRLAVHNSGFFGTTVLHVRPSSDLTRQLLACTRKDVSLRY
jgi:hypothetical protein